ncbi:MAG: WD40 repeat domain-containing protein [Armatimonadetes bacterium]|nr:WD40 repeat domain-containing protein [Armatimonadota bacterium]
MTDTLPQAEQELRAHDAPVRLIAPGPDGLLLTGDTEMRAVIWAHGIPVHKFEMKSLSPRLRPIDLLRAAAFTDDGTSAIIARGGYLVAMSIEDQAVVWRYRPFEYLPFLVSSPHDFQRSSTGAIVACFDNGSLCFLSPNGKLVWRTRDNDSPNWVAIDEANTRIVAADSYSVTTWELHTGRKTSLHRTGRHAYGFRYSTVTGVVALRETDIISLWRLEEEAPFLEIPLHPGAPILDLTPDEGTLVFGQGHEVVFHDLISGRVRSQPVGSQRLVSLAVDDDGQLLTGHADGCVRIWAVSR